MSAETVRLSAPTKGNLIKINSPSSGSENEGYLPLPEDGLRLRYQGEIHELGFTNGRVVAADDSLTVDDKLKGLFNIMLAVRDRYSYLLPGE